MQSPIETYDSASRDLDSMGNALVEGANMAPRLTMDTIIAMRSILDRHRPVEKDRFNTVCGHCGSAWECPDAADVLKVFGLPESDEE